MRLHLRQSWTLPPHLPGRPRPSARSHCGAHLSAEAPGGQPLTVPPGSADSQATPWDPPGHTVVSLHAPWWHVAAKAPGPSCLLAQVSSGRQIPGPESPTGRPLCLRWGLWTEAQTRTQVQTPVARIHFASE